MNMGSGGNGQLAVPPGFRFHPTDEELLYYYLRKKVSYEPIDLDVIREVDLNKLEPWDLKEKCRIGSGPQNEWYFFSHKDKKYPTGTRTNRATAAGFWKATGRDKAIHLSDSKRIGMRKTLVFYTGRAPHGQKTDWIMHEYRLDDHNNNTNNADHIQEEGWVVCRVFKKKNHINRGGFQQEINNIANNNNNIINSTTHNHHDHHLEDFSYANMKASGSSASLLYHHHHHHPHDHHDQPKHHHHHQPLLDLYDHNNYPTFDASMHLPQLFSPESSTAAALTTVPSSSFPPPPPLSLTTAVQDIECGHSLLRLTSADHHHSRAPPPPPPFHGGPAAGDWTFLDKLLANSSNNNNNSNNNINHALLAHQAAKCNPSSSSSDHHHQHHEDHHHIHLGNASSTQRLFPFQYLGCDSTEIMKFPK